MNDSTNTSGAFMRPSLIDYLLVAEREQLRVGLLVHVGRLELGLVGVDGGRVVYAELPGSSGDLALALLTQVPGTRVVPQAWDGRPANVERSWRELVSDQQLNAAPGLAWRLDHVLAELAEIDELERPADDVTPTHDPSVRDAVAELLDWGAAHACLHADIGRAHALLTRREQLCAPDLVCAANLERLHLRLLEDEITTAVAEEQR